jgi:hypothetical protein
MSVRPPKRRGDRDLLQDDADIAGADGHRSGGFQGPVTFEVTYSDKYYMPGTRDVDATVVINVQVNSDGLLKFTPDGKPDFYLGASS